MVFVTCDVGRVLCCLLVMLVMWCLRHMVWSCSVSHVWSWPFVVFITCGHDLIQCISHVVVITYGVSCVVMVMYGVHNVSL